MVIFKVENMSCGGCAARISRAIQALDQNAKVDVSLQERLVRVDSDRTAQVISDALASAGYPASSREEDTRTYFGVFDVDQAILCIRINTIT